MPTDSPPSVAPRRISTAVGRLFAWLRRETASTTLVPEIDGLRFFAIAAVVVFHINGVLTSGTFAANGLSGNPALDDVFRTVDPNHPLHLVLNQGLVGVRLFFAISGFVLALPFAKAALLGAKPPGLKPYFLRRLTRLEPPYILSLLTVSALWLFLLRRPAADVLPLLGQHLLYIHNLWSGSGLNSVLWSLEIEVQFYCLAPLLARVFLLPIVARRATLWTAIVGLGLAQVFVFDSGWCKDHQTLLNFLHYFLVGFALCDHFLVEWQQAPSSHLRWDVVATVGWLAVPAVLIFKWLPDVSLPIVIFVAYVGTFRGVLWRSIVRLPFVYIVGGMCYTIYLYHGLVCHALAPWTAKVFLGGGYVVNIALQVLLLGAAILLSSVVLFALGERPFMVRDWPQRLAARLRR